MYIWLILALIFAAAEAIAVSKDTKRLEYVAKPAAMIFLFLWLYTTTGLTGIAFWFGLGILFSLAGDVLLMVPGDRMFLPGLVAFLLAHVLYTAGFMNEASTLSLWSLILLVVIAINVRRLMQRIAGAMRARGQNSLVIPVTLYGTVISVMLFAALSTIYNPVWSTSAAFLVSLGAFFFCASDLMLAWNRFVSPLKNGHFWNITLYYLGQIGIVSGVVSQFG